ncbi:uncharacterized protein MELLADRAFT_92059 [Melampsora larici-populina 98AG31]|uniref:Uncharacterized protein n=1 Tax=Melampsora larici-populina (strain 98AG31 / pathotype 3-4-7) TaxID=747676 RepID=F4S1D7_MELLP|nr:uncharacterized protein MELLADRAFT_92059 [Melampsora larici-populina 98AG31]EGG01578.1 hypothetical protein MELLADRAFT_92059 [Melampsora larici-populina 98AG31]
MSKYDDCSSQNQIHRLSQRIKLPHLPATHESQCDHHPTWPCDHKVMAHLVIR